MCRHVSPVDYDKALKTRRFVCLLHAVLCGEHFEEEGVEKIWRL